MCTAIYNPADHQFRRYCRISTAVSLVLFITCSQASTRLHGSPAGLVLAGLAGAAFFAELISVGLLLTRLRDEFQRALLIRSLLWATLITMALTMIWGFVELQSHGTVPHLDVLWIPLMLVCFTAGAKLLIFRQYRPESE
ncbi:MAG: hypothetical protein JO051_18175 [Acidobacteriaceae bacterium]|nr:hypothetical protein [Acidobacteriaceae bacterium]